MRTISFAKRIVMRIGMRSDMRCMRYDRMPDRMNRMSNRMHRKPNRLNRILDRMHRMTHRMNRMLDHTTRTRTRGRRRGTFRAAAQSVSVAAPSRAGAAWISCS